MITSHQNRLIFLKARKVAGTSFEIALSRYCGPDDIISPLSRADEKIRVERGYRGGQNFDYGFARFLKRDRGGMARLFNQRIPLKFFNHMPARLVRFWLGGKVFDDYLKVAVVRNPWDRAVSMFFWKHAKSGRDNDIERFTTYLAKNPSLLTANHRLYQISGRVVVDHFIRYEHFEADTLALEAKRPALKGLYGTLAGVNAKGATRDRTMTTAEIFDRHPEADRLVRKLNAWEIETFGYERPR